MTTRSQFCTLLVRNEKFALPVERVQELIRGLEMTPIALAPLVIRGLINLRGQIVMAIDLKRRLGLADEFDPPSLMNVVVRTDDGPVSLLVDDVSEVVELSLDECEPVPSTLRGEVRELVRGIYKLPNSLLLVLDTDRVLDLSWQS